MSKRTSAPQNEGIPKWFVTYSDVITLLMTFFILLLTFASSEPEGFALMKESFFGTGGSAGDVGIKLEGIDRDSIVLRLKPPAGRLTSHGSEIPPMHTDPVKEAASKGLQALQETNDLSRQESIAFDVQFALYFDEDGTPSSVATQHAQMLAKQLRRLPLELTLSVSAPQQVRAACRLAEIMTTRMGCPAGSVSVALDRSLPQRGTLRLTLLRNRSSFTQHPQP